MPDLDKQIEDLEKRNTELAMSVFKWKAIAQVLYEDLKHGFSAEALVEDLKAYDDLLKEQL